MLRVRGFICALFIAVLLFGSAAESFAQGVIKRRRIKRETLKKIEAYFEGGYFIGGMSPAEDAINNGVNKLRRIYNDYNATSIVDPDVTPGVYSYDNRMVETVRSMGGGLNFNLNRNYGIGIKFLFTQHQLDSKFGFAIDSTQLVIPDMGEVIVGVNEDFTTNYRYQQAPILLNFFYHLRPAVGNGNLRFTVGGGPGIYTSSVRVDHYYSRVVNDIINDPPLINPPNNFVRSHDEIVVSPLGGYLFGAVNIKGSNVISINLSAEYHFVPETDADEWHVDKGLESWFYGLDEVRIEDMTEFTNEYFSSYRPDKVNLSGIRLAAAVSFAF
jgi:hypothetical protein